MIVWRVRNFISKEANVVFKMYKTLIRFDVEYCTQAKDPESRYANCSVILSLESIQKRVTKTIKSLKNTVI